MNTIISTTAVACIREGRSYIGFEKDPKYHAIATRRAEDEKANLKLF